MKSNKKINSIYDCLNILTNRKTTTLNTLTTMTTTTTSGFSHVNNKTLFANSRLIYS